MNVASGELSYAESHQPGNGRHGGIEPQGSDVAEMQSLHGQPHDICRRHLYWSPDA